MTALIHAQDLSKSYGIKTLFEGLKLGIEEGDRIGMIGPNGAGKTTLLKILAGLEIPDEGQVIRRRDLKLTYVPQVSSFPPDQTVMDVLLEAAKKHHTQAEHRLGEANAILGRVGFSDPDQKVSQLSGGWQKRLTLACGLLGDPDLILFDEPTNHLDTEGVWWLESLLHRARFSWLMISHDRSFIDQTASKIIAIERIFENGLFISKGRYSHYCEQREAYLKAQEQQREALMNKVRRETEWLRAGVKARTTKAKYRIDAAHALIEELAEVQRRREEPPAAVAFSATNRKTRKLVEAKGIAKAYGDRRLLTDLDLILSPGSRLGLLGTNGSGKSTLMRLLQGELTPDSGSVIHAVNLRTVYFDQERSQIDPTITLEQALSPTGTDSVIYRGRAHHVYSWASRFKFHRDQLLLPVCQVSGGEQARLLIARLMLEEADVLFLDEPTNDLDIPTIELLEEGLISFPGAVVLVSHDRTMLSRVCQQFIGFDGAGKVWHCSDYQQWRRELETGEPIAKKASAAKSKPKQSKPKKLSFTEQYEYDRIEARILEAEEELEQARSVAEDPTIASNGAKLMEAYEAVSKAEKQVAELYDRWSFLSDKVEAAAN